MPTFKELYDVHLKYIEYLLERTHLYHQTLKNIKETGDDVEIEIRNFIKYFLPARFRVTHGYIVSIKDSKSDPDISPQADLIIVDELVPNRIFSIGKSEGVDLVPVEAVVGVFEIKRTLNKESLTKAIEHLSEIKNIAGIEKGNSDYYLPGGDIAKGLTTGYNSNPMLGIISLTSEFKDPQAEFVTNFSGQLLGTEIDAVISLDGFLGCMVEKSAGSLIIETVRKKDKEYLFGFLTSDEFSQLGLISRSIGVILGYLSFTTGRRMNFKNYFFNEKTWEVIKK